MERVIVMIVNIRKATSVLLCAVMLFCTCSCAGKTETRVVSTVESFAELVIKRKYDKLEQLSTEGDEDLRTMMSLSSESADLNEQARVIIMDTMKYEIDEDSFEGGAMYRENSIDVTFEYVDFEKLTNPDFYANIDEFKEDVQNCTDTVKKTVTLVFVSDDDGYLCDNLGDLTSVFLPIYRAEFNFPDTYASYIGGISFTGEGYDEATNTYTDVSTIECVLDITGDGTLMDWDYGYRVNRDGEQVFNYSDNYSHCPSVISADHDAYIDEDLPEGSLLPDGEYEFVFYDENGITFATATATVTHTATPSPTPTPVATPTPVPENDMELGVFFCPEGDYVVLPGTDIVYTLPEGSGLQFRDIDYEWLPRTVLEGNPDHMVVFADVNEYMIRDFRAYYIPDAGVDSPEAAEALQGFVDQAASYYDEGEYTVTETTVDMNGRTFRVVYFENLQEGLDGYDHVYVLAGNDEVSYVVVFYEDNIQELEEDIGAWAAENSGGGETVNPGEPIL